MGEGEKFDEKEIETEPGIVGEPYLKVKNI